MNIFGATGQILEDIDPAEVEKLDPPVRETLLTLLDSAAKMASADKAFVDAGKAVSVAARDMNLKQDACLRIVPQRTFHDEWREQVAKLPPKPIDRATQKRALEAAEAADEAAALHQKALTDEIMAKNWRTVCRKDYETALRAWAAIAPGPKTTADLMRANVAAETARKHAILRGEIKPDPKPKERVHLNAIDVALSAGKGRGSNVNARFTRPQARTPAPIKR
jgi:hypothetical protein